MVDLPRLTLRSLWLLAVVLAFWSLPSSAAPGDDPEACDAVNEWTEPGGFGGPVWWATPRQAFDQWEDDYCAAGSGREPCTAVGIGWNGSTWFAKMEYTNSLGNRAQTTNQALGKRAQTYGTCPVEEADCAAGTGKYISLRGADTSELGKTSCILGCAIEVGRVAVKDDTTGEYVYNGKVTGGTCTNPPPGPGTSADNPETESVESNEYCATTEGGQTFCVPQPKKNCGYYNNEYTCLPAPESSQCIETASGKRFCAQNAPTPPVPDNGTPGTKAAPDDVIETKQNSATAPGAGNGTTTTNNVNVYNNTTVAGSSRGGESAGATPGSGGKAVGTGDAPEGEEDGPATGEASGGAACDAPPVCTHDDQVQCAQLEQAWRTRCVTEPTEADLLEAIGATAAEKGEEPGPNDGTFDVPDELDDTAFIGGAACPNAPVITVKGQSVDLQRYWDTACEMASLFAPLVQAMGALIAAMILFRSNVGGA